MFYRVYPLGLAGHFQPPIELECASDEAAVAALASVHPPLRHGCELWQLKRFIGRYRPGPDGRFEREG